MSVQASGSPEQQRFDYRAASNPPHLPRSPQPSDRCVLVGAGPSSLHMAHLLRGAGFANLTVLERSHRHGGKAVTIPHGSATEMRHDLGPCFLSATYDAVRELARELGAGEEIPQEGMEVTRLYSDSDASVKKCREGTAAFGHDFADGRLWTSEAMRVIAQAQAGPDEVVDGNALAEIVAGAFVKYATVHEMALGTYDQRDATNGGWTAGGASGLPGLPPQPTPAHWRDPALGLNKSFRGFLELHGCDVLKPLFAYILTGQGYGATDACPAYYGLLWLTPAFIGAALGLELVADAEGNPVSVKPRPPETKSQFVRGYGAIWDALVERDELDIRYNVDIRSIERKTSPSHSQGSNDNEEGKRPPTTVVVKGTYRPAKDNGGEEEETVSFEESYDWLFLGAPLQHCASYMADLDDEEADVFGSIVHHRFRASLIDRPPEPTRGKAHEDVFIDCMMVPEKSGIGIVRGLRDTRALYRPGDADVAAARGERREQIIYQFVQHREDGAHRGITEAVLDEKRDAYFRLLHGASVRTLPEDDPLPVDIGDDPYVRILQNGDPNGKRAKGSQDGDSSSWEYFYHFLQKDLEDGKPWKLLKRQGRNNTFYVHASTRFESILDIVHYNNALFERIIRPNIGK